MKKYLVKLTHNAKKKTKVVTFDAYMAEVNSLLTEIDQLRRQVTDRCYRDYRDGRYGGTSQDDDYGPCSHRSDRDYFSSGRD